MARRVHLADHLSSEDLFQHYRSAHHPVERSHWHIVWLKSQGTSTEQIAAAVGYSRVWVLEILRRYNEQGPDGLIDRRRHNAGHAPLLGPEEQAELEALLERGKTPEGLPWTGPRVARWIEEQTGREKVRDQRGWDYLIRLGFSAQTPRPRHQQASEQEQAAFKKDAAPAYRSQAQQ